MVDLSSYKELFIKTARDNVNALVANIRKLSQESSNKECIEEVHRNAHTLKGKSLMMGYQTTAALAKKIEDMFYDLQKGTHTLLPKEIQWLQQSVGRLQASIENISQSGQELDLTAELEQF